MQGWEWSRRGEGKVLVIWGVETRDWLDWRVTRWIWILQDEHFRGQQTLSQARRLADSREEFLPRG